MDRENKLEITARLREAVEQAKASYERAKGFDRAAEFHHHLGATDPGGSQRLVTRSETEVSRQYRQALKNFLHFVLDGKLPEESRQATE